MSNKEKKQDDDWSLQNEKSLAYFFFFQLISNFQKQCYKVSLFVKASNSKLKCISKIMAKVSYT